MSTKEPVVLSVGVIGRGLIGSEVLDQITSEKGRLLNERGIDIRIVAISDIDKQLNVVEGLPLGADWKAAWEATTTAPGFENFDKTMLAAANGVVVDCTASAFIANRYALWLGKGLHVVTPNKKAGSGDLKYFKEVKASQGTGGHFMYECTVGAGLPIIDSIQGLLDTGDKIKTIEGIFSGTLSYIFNTFDGSEPFSAVVSAARKQGFTEPDPRDDLNGLDVARKVVILARECGMDVEIADVPIESLVAPELAKLKTAEEYLAKLPDFDGEFKSKFDEAKANGEVLRYVGSVDAANKQVSVKLRRFPTTHPFAGLAGADNIVQITTERYSPPTGQPLVVRGPGAGAAVTAAGVFYDVLRLAHRLGCSSANPNPKL